MNSMLLACAVLRSICLTAAASAQHLLFSSTSAAAACTAASPASAAMATPRMPIVFVSHGSPTFAIDDNPHAPKWNKFLRKQARPKAILCVSAHWYARGIAVTYNEHPETIHDFGGFSDELFQVQYPAPGDRDLCKRVKELLHAGSPSRKVELAEDWGLDHGTWVVLKRVWPEADIPVVQLRIDSSLTAADHL
jgi:4,5-DOPA dioxygenase extradiol